MGVFDFLRRDSGHQSRLADQGKTITTAPKPGTLYYLRARNVKSGFDDILCFDSDIMRRRYIGTARESTPTPNDWYFTEYETTAESRLQEELENQRKALEKSYKQDIAKLEYKIRGLQSDKRNLQIKTSGGTWQQKYNNELHANSIIKRDLQQERKKNAELLALIQQLKERKQAEQKAPAPDKKPILQAIQKDLHTILCKASPELLEQYASEYEQELNKLGKYATPLQRGLTLAIIARQINNMTITK